MSKRKKAKYYVVWEGMDPGIYLTWPECQRQIQGYSGAKYKSFSSLEEARNAFAGSYFDYVGSTAKPAKKKVWSPDMEGGPILPSWSVDAACSGNPGVLEYRGVLTETGEELFRRGPFPKGTNNIGEFLAIVHALALLQEQGSDLPLYTDSRTALAWIRHKRVKSKLVQDASTERLFGLIARAEEWLCSNSYNNKLMKWPTDTWGEIPADFGRK